VLTRGQLGLLTSGVLSIAAIGVGIDLLGNAASNDVAWIVGAPTVLLGLLLFAGAILGWERDSRYAQGSLTVWAGVLLLAACGIGGADNLIGIALAAVAIVMGSLSVWVAG
jgi:hypothetical protein